MGGRDDEQQAIDDFEVDDALRRRTEPLLKGDHLRPAISHIHLYPWISQTEELILFDSNKEE